MYALHFIRIQWHVLFIILQDRLLILSVSIGIRNQTHIQKQFIEFADQVLLLYDLQQRILLNHLILQLEFWILYHIDLSFQQLTNRVPLINSVLVDHFCSNSAKDVLRDIDYPFDVSFSMQFTNLFKN